CRRLSGNADVRGRSQLLTRLRENSKVRSGTRTIFSSSRSKWNSLGPNSDMNSRVGFDVATEKSWHRFVTTASVAAVTALMDAPDSDYIFKHFLEPRSALMKRNCKFVLSSATLVAALCTAAFAQSAPPTCQADPSVYKLIFEDQNFRVIAGTWARA
ncbi:MAG: hypothetical protein ABJA75_10195, partial [Bradyrhizobium sp.]